MNRIKKIITYTMLAFLLPLHLNAQNETSQTKNHETYWQSLKISAGTGTAVGIVYGLICRIAHKTSNKFFDNQYITWPVNQLISYYMIWQHNKAIDIFDAHAQKYHMPLDGDVAKIIALLHHLCIISIPHE